jgi:hypothetical protein
LKKTNIIFIVLIVFLVLTGFFWFQVMTIKEPPPVKPPEESRLRGKDAEAFVKLAEALLVGDVRQPLRLYMRDPFVRQEVVVTAPVVKTEPVDKLVLSSIIHSNSNALAVVNGKILAEGDTIYDKESGVEFMVGNIEHDKVEIINGDKKYTLKTKSKVASR